MDVSDFLQAITHSEYYRGQIVHVERLPARKAKYAELATPLPRPLREVLARDGIKRLYVHQVEAIEAVRRGEHVVVVTATASGKTLCYNLPVIETLLADSAARALYLFPTKALTQDQLKTLKRYRELDETLPIVAGAYDGDTPGDLRRTLRDEGNVILTNPDMLHSGILPNHSSWAQFLAGLRYVVVDEIHTYRGIFGSHVANVIRRLRRVCAHYGAQPQFICCSATIGNPAEHAEHIVGLPMTLVDRDTSPRGAKRFILWNPPYLDEAKLARRSPNIEAQHLMCDLIERYHVQTICFVRARTTAELLYRYVQEELQRRSPRLARVVRAYRSGYLPSERREIERQLFEGELMGVTSTNALELGIDVGSLDACLMVGYPGSVASTWQQAGRAGRKQADSLAILIAREDPIDQYLMRHPQYFFGQSHERAVIDHENPYILHGHVRCAAKELPITGDDVALFGQYLGGIMALLQEAGEVRERDGRFVWCGPRYPAGDVSLRTADVRNYVIQDVDTGKVIGEMDEWGAFTLLHTEAVYLHDGETYFVEELNLTERVARVRRKALDYFTVSVDRTEIQLLEDPDEPARSRQWRISTVGTGPAQVTTLVYMFRKTKFGEKDAIGFGNLSLPPLELETVAFWLAPPRQVLQRVREYGRRPEDGLQGIANAMAGVLPAHVMCDPTDVGTVVDSGNLGTPAVFIFDRYPGGAGYAEKTYEIVEDVVQSALELIQECGCDGGCPSCVGSPLPYAEGLSQDLEARGKVPDKEAALCILHDILGLEPYVPKPVTTDGAPRPAPVVVPEATSPESVPPTPLVLTPLPEPIEAKLRRRLRQMRPVGKR